MIYKYYRKYNNETNRPEWLTYIDHLIDLGRLYVNKPENEPLYTCITEYEYKRLSSLLFQDNTLADQEEIILSCNREEIRDAVIGYVESDSKDAEFRLSNTIKENVLNHYKQYIIEIFDTARQSQGVCSNE